MKTSPKTLYLFKRVYLWLTLWTETFQPEESNSLFLSLCAILFLFKGNSRIICRYINTTYDFLQKISLCAYVRSSSSSSFLLWYLLTFVSVFFCIFTITSGRQIGVSDEKGCLLLADKDGNPTIDIRESKSLPISIIDTGKVPHLNPN